MKEVMNGVAKTEEVMPMELRHRTDLLAIIAQAVIDPRVDVAKIERLLAMQQAIVKEQRKVEYNAAMARVQGQIPQIDKFGQGKNSKYGKLEDIDLIARPIYTAEGFSVGFNEESRTDKTVTFVMTMAHANGHDDTKRLTLSIDTSYRNSEGKSIRPAIQDDTSTVSYARRYLLSMHLNIVTKDQDSDGESRALITEDQQRDLLAAIDEYKMDKGRFFLFMGVGAIEEILVKDLKKAINAIDVQRRALLEKKQ